MLFWLPTRSRRYNELTLKLYYVATYMICTQCYYHRYGGIQGGKKNPYKHIMYNLPLQWYIQEMRRRGSTIWTMRFSTAPYFCSLSTVFWWYKWYAKWYKTAHFYHFYHRDILSTSPYVLGYLERYRHSTTSAAVLPQEVLPSSKQYVVCTNAAVAVCYLEWPWSFDCNKAASDKRILWIIIKYFNWWTNDVSIIVICGVYGTS